MQTITNKNLSDTMYYKNLPVLTYSIDYPAFATTCSTAAAKRINLHYETDAREQEQKCRTEVFRQATQLAEYRAANSYPFFGYEWKATYQITYNQYCLTSLYLEQYSYLGGAHGNTVRTSDTWDFRTGRRLTLGEFHIKNSTGTNRMPSAAVATPKILLPMIETQIVWRLKTTPGSYFDDYATLLRNSFHPESFYLTPEGLVIYYQLYDIAPYVTGIPEFLIPDVVPR